MTEEPTEEIKKIKQTSAKIADLILDKMATSGYPFQAVLLGTMTAAKMAAMQAYGMKVVGQGAQHGIER